VISILTPSFGYARFITDAIESVRNQRHYSTQHVVVDGGSLDGTVEILQAAQGLTWISEPDRGQSDALNKAMDLASGDVIGWLNADEFYLKGCLRRVAEIFEDPTVDVLYGDSLRVDRAGRIIRLVAHHRFDEEVLRYHGCYIPSCSFFVRRSLLADWSWDDDAKFIMDWDLYLWLASQDLRILYVPEPFGAFRVHEAQVTAEPLAIDAPERRRVLMRHGLNWSGFPAGFRRRKARVKRIMLKIWEGAYLRQQRIRRTAGRDARWWL
jgi:glycosyltransferase involved in cell wall biosynthesis